jgi:outer membrane protein assembly factor BamB
LQPDERFLVADGIEVTPHVFTTRNRTLICRDSEKLTLLWQRELAHAVAWIGQHADRILAGGPEGVTALALRGGEYLWDYPAPPVVTWSQTMPQRGRGHLSAFRLAAGQLYFLEGSSRLFAVDARMGRVLWTRQASGAFLRWPDCPGPLSSIDVASEYVLQIPELGEVLDAHTGQPRASLSPAPDRAVFLDAKTGTERWSRPIEGWTSWNGLPVQQQQLGPDSLLVVVPRNHGSTLERIDGGRWTWTNPPLLRFPMLQASGLSWDRSAVYAARDGTLMSFALEDGRLRWQKTYPGPAGQWRTRRVGDWLFAWPVERRCLVLPVPLSAGRLEWRLSWSAEESRPVLICDVRTGQLVQRLNLPAALPQMDIEQSRKRPALQASPMVTLTPAGFLVYEGDLVVAMASPLP